MKVGWELKVIFDNEIPNFSKNKNGNMSRCGYCISIL